MLTKYRPNPLLLPQNAPLARGLYSHNCHTGQPRLSSDEVGTQYDLRTIFYDVFLDAGGQLRAIGPPLVNLESALFPLRARLGESTRTYSSAADLRMRAYDRVSTYDFGIRHDTGTSNCLQLTIDANGLAHLDTTIDTQTLSPVELQLVTVQKDNLGPWIRQWCTYYNRLGCTRVMIYDNQSSDTLVYADIAAALGSSCDVVVVSWDFRYGPMRSWQNMFCQVGALTHAAIALGQSEWMANFDIDEYLVLSDRYKGIPEFLCKTAWPWHGFVRFDSYIVPNIRDATGTPSPNEFLYREIRPRRRAWKYIVRTKRVRAAGAHVAEVGFSLCRRIGVDTASFRHLLGLGTNWKRELRDRSVVPALDPTKYVKDTSLRDALSRLEVR